MKMKFNKRCICLIFCLIAIVVHAQQIPLKIGGSLPEEVWETPLEVINYTQKTTTLKQDRDKLILLDFWATWCSPCLKNFPYMEKLQEKFGNQIKILPVTTQERSFVEDFFKSQQDKQYNHITSVVNGEIFKKLFPHFGVPYIVWIKDGKLINTTDAEQVTEKAISEILEGDKSSLQTVIQMDRGRPFMLSENFDLEKGTSLMSYSLLTKGKVRAIGSGNWFHREGNVVHGRQMTNISLMEIYKGIMYQIFEGNGDTFGDKRIINLVKNNSDLEIDYTLPETDFQDKMYSIEFIVPVSKAETLYAGMMKMLNEMTDYTATLEKKSTKCLVLKRTSVKDKIATKGGEQLDNFFRPMSVMKNVTFDYLMSALNANSNISPLPVFDETGYNGKIDLELGNITDLTSLKKALNKYDLDLVESERDLNMLFIRDK